MCLTYIRLLSLATYIRVTVLAGRGGNGDIVLRCRPFAAPANVPIQYGLIIKILDMFFD